MQRQRKSSSFKKRDFRTSVFEHAVLCEGYLEKRATNVLQPWQRRYFTLQSHYVKYYTDENKIQKDLRGVLDLRTECQSVELNGKAINLLSTGADGSATTVAALRAASASDAQNWSDAIQSVLTGLALPEDDPSPSEAPKLKFLVVSAPEYGPDGSGGYTFPVMEQLLICAKSSEQRITIAYDWANSSNKFPEDEETWSLIAKTDQFEGKATLIKGTRWFSAYSGGIKQAIKSACQEGNHCCMVCVQGGAVSQVEAREMPIIREQTISDLKKLGIMEPVIKIQKFRTYHDFERFVQSGFSAKASKTHAGGDGWNAEHDGAIVKEGPALLHKGKKEGWIKVFLCLGQHKLACFDHSKETRLLDIPLEGVWELKQLELLPDDARRSRHSQLYPFTVRSGSVRATFACQAGRGMWDWGVAIRWRGIPCIVRTFDGQIFEMRGLLADPLSLVKDEVEKQIGIPTNSQKLYLVNDNRNDSDEDLALEDNSMTLARVLDFSLFQQELELLVMVDGNTASGATQTSRWSHDPLPGCSVVVDNPDPLWTDPSVLQERLLVMLRRPPVLHNHLKTGLIGSCTHGAEKNVELLISTGIIDLPNFYAEGNHPVSMALEGNHSPSRANIVKKLIQNGAPIGHGAAAGYDLTNGYTFFLLKPPRMGKLIVNSITGAAVHPDDKSLVRWMLDKGDGAEYNEKCADALIAAAETGKTEFSFHSAFAGKKVTGTIGITVFVIPPAVGSWMRETLVHLNLRNNNLVILPNALFEAVNLRSLNVSKNCLLGVPEGVKRLGALQSLRINDNLVEQLPSALGDMTELTDLVCMPNPLSNPPMSVVSDGLPAIQQFFRDGAAAGYVENRDMKIMVLGLSEAGKTSLIKALTCRPKLRISVRAQFFEAGDYSVAWTFFEQSGLHNDKPHFVLRPASKYTTENETKNGKTGKKLLPQLGQGAGREDDDGNSESGSDEEDEDEDEENWDGLCLYFSAEKSRWCISRALNADEDLLYTTNEGLAALPRLAPGTEWKQGDAKERLPEEMIEAVNTPLQFVRVRVTYRWPKGTITVDTHAVQQTRVHNGRPVYESMPSDPDAASQCVYFEEASGTWCVGTSVGGSALYQAPGADAATPAAITAPWTRGRSLRHDWSVESVTCESGQGMLFRARFQGFAWRKHDFVEQDTLHCGRSWYETIAVHPQLRLYFDEPANKTADGVWRIGKKLGAEECLMFAADPAAKSPTAITMGWKKVAKAATLTRGAADSDDDSMSAEERSERSVVVECERRVLESQLTRVGDRTVGLDQSAWTITLADGTPVSAKIFDFAGQQEYYLTHKLFLTSHALYVVAFDLSKFSPANFHRLLLFWVLGIQNAAPGAMLVIAATHADMLEAAETDRRCAHALSLLEKRQQRLRARCEKRIRKAEAGLRALQGQQRTAREMISGEKEQGLQTEIAAATEELELMVVLPSKIIAVSSTEGLMGIDELRTAIREALQRKDLFPELGEKIPLSYDRVRRFARDARLDAPYMQLAQLKATLRASDALDDGVIVRALKLLHDQGELLHSPSLPSTVFLALDFLVDLFKLLLRHDHEESTTFDSSVLDGLDQETFGRHKQEFLRSGVLNIALLRRLWQPLKLDEDTFNSMVLLMEQFDIGMVSKYDEEDHTPTEFLLPSFFPDFLPAGLWPSTCPPGEVSASRLFVFRDWMPAGLIQRLQVCLYRISLQSVFAQEGSIMSIGGCKVLSRHKQDQSTSASSPVLEVVARAASYEQLWLSSERVFSVIDKLLTQWPGLKASVMVVHRLADGARVLFEREKLAQLRREGVKMVSAIAPALDKDDGDEGGGGDESGQVGEGRHGGMDGQQPGTGSGSGSSATFGRPGRSSTTEVVPIDQLLGPLSDSSRAETTGGVTIAKTAANTGEQSEKQREEAHEQGRGPKGRVEQAAKEAQVAAGGSGGGVSVVEVTPKQQHYRLLIDGWVQTGTPWVMLSYEVGTKALATAVFEVLVGLGFPVWIDTFGGVFADINDSIAHGVGGAAVICPFLTDQYNNSLTCKKELGYAESRGKKIVPLLAQAGFEPRMWLSVITSSVVASTISLASSSPAAGEASALASDDLRLRLVPLVEVLEGSNMRQAAATSALTATAIPVMQRRLSDNDANTTAAATTLGASNSASPALEPTLEEWLRSLTPALPADVIPEYVAALREVGLDTVDDLFVVEEEDLTELGIRKFHAKKMLRWVNAQKGNRGLMPCK